MRDEVGAKGGILHGWHHYEARFYFAICVVRLLDVVWKSRARQPRVQRRHWPTHDDNRRHHDMVGDGTARGPWVSCSTSVVCKDL